MAAINMLNAKNIVNRAVYGAPRQELSFLLAVENLAPVKRVTVHWCGEDGRWRTMQAAYRGEHEGQRELWQASGSFPLNKRHAIPGNIAFSACLECNNQTFWDNNHGNNHHLEADAGLVLLEDVPVRNANYRPLLHMDEVLHQVDVAVKAAIEPRAVTLHWTTDGWVTHRRVRCRRYRNHWDLTNGSNARNPNRYGWMIWRGTIPVQDTYRLEYAIECRGRSGTSWDNFQGRNYLLHRGTLRVMTLNLHTWQEENQMEKFKQIAKAIDELKIDVVCLQEVGENWNDGNGDWESNAARIINDNLSTPYHLHTDWSHLGFDRFREGVAILSRYDFVFTDSGYVSGSHDIYDIHSRKIVMAQIRIPHFGLFNIFSAHLSWPTHGFREQFERLHDWATQRHGDQVAATLLAGDFNVRAGSEAYRQVVNTREYEDQFLKIANPHAFNRIFRDGQTDLARYLHHDRRIDYLFLRKGSRLRAIQAGEVFTEQHYGRVSDHVAYFAEFELI